MRFSTAFLTWLAILATSTAQEKPPQTPEMSPSAERESALDELLSERESADALALAIAKARKSGVAEQAVLEARFLFHVDRREDAAIAAMLPEFLKQRGTFKIEDSAIFGVKEDWLAVVEYVQAIHALENGQAAAFKTHITEAFWLSPRQASAFASHIDRLRLEESMREVKIDLNTRLTSLNEPETVSLSSLIAEKKALIFHFWSPSSSESEASMPDYLATAKSLTENAIAMVSILPDNAPQHVADARAMIRPLGNHPPGAWLIDSKENPFTQQLRVQQLPIFVIISTTGNVLFNGHPADPALWTALQKIDPQIARPAAPRAPE
jgi:hypothetical protein